MTVFVCMSAWGLVRSDELHLALEYEEKRELSEPELRSLFLIAISI